jgi:hypothetical protein
LPFTSQEQVNHEEMDNERPQEAVENNQGHGGASPLRELHQEERGAGDQQRLARQERNMSPVVSNVFSAIATVSTE